MARASKQPLYDQLVDILTEKIEQEYRPGDLMPSERELSERYGLSRTTVRLALQELERLGMVVRKHGRGTFVADQSAQVTNLMQAYSFTDQMRSMGRVPETTILEFSEIDADKNLAQHMGVRLGDRLFKLKRLRSADGIPMMVERSFLPVRKFLTLKRPLLDSMPLYEIVENVYHEKIRVAEEEFFASVARPSEAHLLDIPENAPVRSIGGMSRGSARRMVMRPASVSFRFRSCSFIQRSSMLFLRFDGLWLFTYQYASATTTAPPTMLPSVATPML